MNNIQLFDTQETNVSYYGNIKRYEDLFNCRIMHIGCDQNTDDVTNHKFSNMDYPVLYENLKVQMINKKIKMQKMKAKLKKKSADFSEDQDRSNSLSSLLQTKTHLKRNSSPLSALENTIQENQIMDFKNTNSAILDSSDDSSDFLSDDEEGVYFQGMVSSRPHRVSFTNSEEHFRLSTHMNSENGNETGRSFQKVDYSHQHYKSYNQFLEPDGNDLVFNIQMDLKALQKSPSYNKYKAEIIRSTILKNKQPKFLVDNSKQIPDKSIFLESSFNELDLNKYPILENQSMNLNVLNVSRSTILENSTSSLQKLQILQTDVFIFDLKDCCIYKEDNDYMSAGYEYEADKDSLDTILFELEQIIPLILEIIELSSQNIETRLMFCCHYCNNHEDNDTTISGGFIKSINPKLLNFFEALGINYKTNFFPISKLKKDIGYKTEGKDDLFNLKHGSVRTNLVQNSSPPLIKKKKNVSHVLAAVSNDTGRLFVKSIEETVYDMGRMSIINKTDVLHEKSPKLEKKPEIYKNLEGSSASLFSRSSEGRQSPATLNNTTDNVHTPNTQSSFFVSKDVRASTNKSPPLHLSGVQNKTNDTFDIIEKKSNSETFTAATGTLVLENQPDTHMLMVNHSKSTRIQEGQKTKPRDVVEAKVDTNMIRSPSSDRKKKPKNNTCCCLM